MLVIDELRRAIERLRQQPEAVQRHIAELIEQALQEAQSGHAPDSFAGAWSDLQDDDEFAYFDRIRHETPPSPPMDEQLAWLDEDE